MKSLLQQHPPLIPPLIGGTKGGVMMQFLTCIPPFNSPLIKGGLRGVFCELHHTISSNPVEFKRL